jgi:hypothetical protein
MKKNKIEKNLEKELTIIGTMVKMGLITFDELKIKMKELGEKYDMTIVLRNHNITTDTTTIEYV